MSVDQRPIADQIHKIGGDEREHDRKHDVDRLQITAERKVGEQRQRAPIERAQERAHRLYQFRADSETVHQRRPKRYGQHEDWSQREGEKQPVHQRESCVIEIFATVGMRDESIESQQQAAAKDRDAVIKALAQPGGPDGYGTVGQPSHHDGVDDAHAHPADLGDDEGKGQAQREDEIRAQWGVRNGLRFHRH